MRPRTSADSEKASSGTAKAISWKSKLASCCRPQENPYATAMARLGPTPKPELLPGSLADSEDGKRGQQRLHGHQRRRRGEDSEQRGDHHDDRLEVVAEQVEARGPDVRDRRVPAGGLLDVLGVDGQIPRGRVELQQPEQRDGEIGAESDERSCPDERVPVGAGEPALTPWRGRGVRRQTLRYQSFTLRHRGLHGCRECLGPVPKTRTGSALNGVRCCSSIPAQLIVPGRRSAGQTSRSLARRRPETYRPRTAARAASPSVT